MKYSHENYMKNRDSIRAAQRRYYEKNKAKICAKYAHHRRAWNSKHKAYLNEHARLNREIASDAYNAEVFEIQKEYLRYLHACGIAK